MTMQEVNSKIDAQIVLLVGLSAASLKTLQNIDNSYLSAALAVKLFDCENGFEEFEKFGSYSPRSSLEPIFKQFDKTFDKKGRR